MKNIVSHLIFVSTFFFILIASPPLSAQESNAEKFKFHSFGISLGAYDPDLDYWKNDTNSWFQNSDFSTSIFVQGFAEYKLYNDFILKGGVAYWQSRAEASIPSYGKTTMLLTGVPLSLDVIYYISPAKLAFVTPYIGIGGEFLFIQYSLDFANKDNPNPVSGTSGLGSGIVGFQLELSTNFAVDLFAQYKIGSYQQSFIREHTSTDPEIPSSEYEVTEDISLTGPAFGITLKYLLK
jgi:hypothetical protein